MTTAHSATDSAGNQPVGFDRVLLAEHEAIRARRQRLEIIGRGSVVRSDPNAAGGLLDDLTGVALSGGGVRSAAFCLGVLQALDASLLTGRQGTPNNERSGIDCIDYLSTVSGGGYIGSSLTAAMYDGGKFPFVSRDDYKDTPAVGHLRDYSNYIFPRGRHTFMAAIAVVLRGLTTNIVFVSAAILFFAAATVFAYPDTATLGAGSYIPQLFKAAACDFGKMLCGSARPSVAFPYNFTLLLMGIVGVALVAWAVARSLERTLASDISGPMIRFVSTLLVLVVASAALDLVPLLLRILFAAGNAKGGLFGSVEREVDSIGIALAPLAGIAAFMSDRLAKFLKNTQATGKSGILIRRLLAFAALWFAALVLPLLLLLLFLRVAVIGVVQTVPGSPNPFVFGPFSADGMVTLPFGDGQAPFALACAVGFLALLFICLFFSPNANSLHRLYRDRLGKAFLFDPGDRLDARGNLKPEAKASPNETPLLSRETSADENDDLVPRDTLKLHEIGRDRGGPYQLINATLNLQSSKKDNRRGRNGDFFLFSGRYVGSEATKYIATDAMEAADPNLDLATAVAISGAAISSNMGSASIPALTPTLALLNMRLGYWMKNPNMFVKKSVFARLKESSKFYLIDEMLGLLDENEPRVYLTDGGHIENLGLYQLLKRRCRAIVAVDAEEDSRLAFAAFATAQRYARIDLGVRIDLPWQGIAAATENVAANFPYGEPLTMVHGPHCALGDIEYPDGTKGMLLYVKASLTGDESDYVMKYKRENPAFPYESTGDQFFTEEQFEAYRALGFHALNQFLTKTSEKFGHSVQLGGEPGIARDNFLRLFAIRS